MGYSVVARLISLLASEPEVLADHLAGYAQLIGVEAAAASRNLRRRWAFKAGIALCIILGIAFSGMSLLLLSAIPASQMPAPWALLAVPGLCLAAAVAGAMLLSRYPSQPAFQEFRDNLSQDAALFRQAPQE